MTREQRTHGRLPGGAAILVLSPEAVAAALLGLLLETLGFRPTFLGPGEAARDGLRRARPAAAVIDCTDAACSPEFLGPATMLGVQVVLVGSRAHADDMRAIAARYDVRALTLPDEIGDLDALLRA